LAVYYAAKRWLFTAVDMSPETHVGLYTGAAAAEHALLSEKF